MASNAWTREIDVAGAKIVPLYVTLFETAPLDDAQLAALGGWPRREGVYTAHEVLESYRLDGAANDRRRLEGTPVCLGCPAGRPRRTECTQPGE